MINIPKYDITDKILSLVASITEKTTKLEIDNNFQKDLYLRKVSKIKSVNSSCAIEANMLTEDEVLQVINNKFVLAPQKEIQEVKNAYLLYDNINKYNPYSVQSFLEAHKTLTTDLIDESGKFRKGNVGIYSGKDVIHMGANPQFVPTLINELFEWAKKSELNPLIKSSIIHYEIEIIHPFSDGNGRMGRIWQSLILFNYNNFFEYLPIETMIFKHQQEYYNAITVSNEDNNSTVFIEFMLEMILKTIDEFNNSNILSNIKQEYVEGLTKVGLEILLNLINYFKDNEFITTEVASNLTNKSRVNIRKYFNKFMKIDILIPIGENKGRKYKLNKQILLK